MGRLLARKLGREFVDTDLLIEKKAGKTIPEIFRENGEIAFRELETEVVKEISGRKNAVIACGGGVVLNQINIERLRKSSLIVYLKASPKVLLERISKDKNERPLLKVADKAKALRRILSLRRPFYEQAADITIDTSKLDINSVVEKIIEEANDSLDR